MISARKVLVIDDHPVVCAGLRLLLEADRAFAVCGEAGDVALAQRLVAELRPEFAVVDLVLGGRDGTELIEDVLVLEPALRVLVYSSQPEQPWARRALRAGARGYVAKTCGLDEVRRALDTIAQGELHVSGAVQRSLVSDYAAGRAGRSPLELLSDRELQVFRLLGTGLGSADIAKELRLSVRTVGTYRERLKNKLGAQTARAGAVRRGVRAHRPARTARAMRGAGNPARAPWSAADWRDFTDEITALNLERCRIAAVAGLMLLFWSTVVNLTVPGIGFSEFWAWMAICTGVYGVLLVVRWRVARADVSPAVRRIYVSAFVIALLVICDGFGFVLSARLPSIASISRGVLLAALIFVLPPARFVALAAANEVILTGWVLWRGVDLTTLTVFVDGTVSMVVGAIASWLLYEAKRADFEQRRQLERRAAEMNELMTITAHDLRSPLLGVKNLLALATSRAQLERERLLAVIGEAVAACEGMLARVGEIVDAYAAEQGAALRGECADLCPALTAAVARARPLAEAKRLRLTLRAPHEEAPVRFDEAALAQVLDNLLGNAVKFSPPGATIEVTLRVRDAGWRVEIGDEGPGVPEAERFRLFQKFSRGTAAATGGEHGSGLGLFIAKTLAERMGASVSYAPRQPRGSVFSVDLPPG